MHYSRLQSCARPLCMPAQCHRPGGRTRHLSRQSPACPAWLGGTPSRSHTSPCCLGSCTGDVGSASASPNPTRVSLHAELHPAFSSHQRQAQVQLTACVVRPAHRHDPPSRARNTEHHAIRRGSGAERTRSGRPAQAPVALEGVLLLLPRSPQGMDGGTPVGGALHIALPVRHGGQAADLVGQPGVPRSCGVAGAAQIKHLLHPGNESQLPIDHHSSRGSHSMGPACAGAWAWAAGRSMLRGMWLDRASPWVRLAGRSRYRRSVPDRQARAAAA